MAEIGQCPVLGTHESHSRRPRECRGCGAIAPEHIAPMGNWAAVLDSLKG